MQFQLDFRSGVPIYTQIIEQVEGMIASGELKPGDQLPTVRQLATDLRVNFNTVARAYRLLDEAGIISTQHGRGTYIWQRPDEATLRALLQTSLDELAHQFVQEARRKGASPAEIRAALEAQLMDWASEEKPDLSHRKGWTP